MIEVRETEAFSEWLSGLRILGPRPRSLVGFVVWRSVTLATSSRSARASANFVSTMAPGTGSITYSAGNLLIVLLCGGDKDSQAKDIALALTLAKEV